jgi:hypothetical protein
MPCQTAKFFWVKSCVKKREPGKATADKHDARESIDCAGNNTVNQVHPIRSKLCQKFLCRQN